MKIAAESDKFCCVLSIQLNRPNEIIRLAFYIRVQFLQTLSIYNVYNLFTDKSTRFGMEANNSYRSEIKGVKSMHNKTNRVRFIKRIKCSMSLRLQNKGMLKE